MKVKDFFKKDDVIKSITFNGMETINNFIASFVELPMQLDDFQKTVDSLTKDFRKELDSSCSTQVDYRLKLAKYKKLWELADTIRRRSGMIQKKIAIPLEKYGDLGFNPSGENIELQHPVVKDELGCNIPED